MAAAVMKLNTRARAVAVKALLALPLTTSKLGYIPDQRVESSLLTELRLSRRDSFSRPASEHRYRLCLHRLRLE